MDKVTIVYLAGCDRTPLAHGVDARAVAWVAQEIIKRCLKGDVLAFPVHTQAAETLVTETFADRSINANAELLMHIEEELVSRSDCLVLCETVRTPGVISQNRETANRLSIPCFEWKTEKENLFAFLSARKHAKTLHDWLEEQALGLSAPSLMGGDR